jgi:hypothetical protein
MGGIARKALRHPIAWLLAATPVCTAAPGAALATTLDPRPPEASPTPDAVPFGPSLSQPARATGTPVAPPLGYRVYRVRFGEKVAQSHKLTTATVRTTRSAATALRSAPLAGGGFAIAVGKELEAL